LKEVERVAAFAADIGAEIVRCGGEVSRAEDTVSRICLALGGVRCEVFAINSYISVCVENMEGESAMICRRIRGRTTDLGRLEQLNQISREICECETDMNTAQERLSINDNVRSVLCGYISSMLVCSVFTLFFGGGIQEAIVAGIAGAVTVLLKRKARNGFGNAVVFTFVCSLLSGTVGALLTYHGLADDYSVVAKGDIMLLVPGISLVCAGRDIIGGELLTGLLSFIETVLIAIALAVGFVLPELWLQR